MSYRFSINPKNRVVARFFGDVRREFQKAFDAEHASSRHLTQAEIARLLDVDRSVINRQLMGTENLTLRRIAELSWVLRRHPKFSLEKPATTAGSNGPSDISDARASTTAQMQSTPMVAPTEAPAVAATSATRVDYSRAFETTV